MKSRLGVDNEFITSVPSTSTNTNGGYGVSSEQFKTVRVDDVLQWSGALFIIAGHMLNAAAVDGWNILAFFLGTVFFLAWTIRVVNKPQMLVNVVAITTCTVGLFRAFG